MSMKKQPTWIDLDEAIELVVQRTGKTRRQAHAAILEACRQGKIPATGTRPDTGERVTIPPEAFPKVH